MYAYLLLYAQTCSHNATAGILGGILHSCLCVCIVTTTDHLLVRTFIRAISALHKVSVMPSCVSRTISVERDEAPGISGFTGVGKSGLPAVNK